MVFNDEQVIQIKDSIYKQLDGLPEGQRSTAREKINSMDAKELEEFVNKNQTDGGCPFCAIAEGKSPCFRLGENDDAIAFLELNPVSKGHSLIISKKHDGEISEGMTDLAKIIGGKLIKLYVPKNVDVNEGKIVGHTVLEVIPNYGEELVKKKADIEDLKILEKEINDTEILEEKETESEAIVKKKEIVEEDIIDVDAGNERSEVVEDELAGLPHFDERIP